MPESSTRQPTVRDVANRAGVSPMTVSRTLSGGLNVKPDLQQRVLAAVEELGYHRNENARSLRPGQASGLIGVAITNLGNPYYGNFALGVEEVAARYGKRMILGNTGEDSLREKQLVADFIGRQVDGLIVVPSAGAAPHLMPERVGKTPLVLASRRVYGLDVDTVLLDDIGGAFQGTAFLLEAGHARVGYLGNLPSVFTSRRRFAGFEQALAGWGIAVDSGLVRREQGEVGAASEAMRSLLDLAEPPTAIFADDNRNTVGALREIGRRMRLGVKRNELPEIVSFDNFELSELMPVPVAVIDHDARQLGREAALLLFDRLENGALLKPGRTIELPVNLAHTDY